MKTSRVLFINLVLVIGVTVVSALPAMAATISLNPLGGGANGNLTDTGLGTTSPLVVASQIINVFLRLLGAISVFFMVYAGWIWIWARGNTEEVQRAKDIIRGSIIGLLVILASFGIMQFVFYYLTKITNAVQ